MTKLRHFDNLNTARFVTFSCYRRQQLLIDKSRIHTFLQELNHARQKYSLRLYGYVVMPEHIHLVIHPPDGSQLGRIIGEIKSKTARRIFASIMDRGERISESLKTRRDGKTGFVFWQKRCYDHNCRTFETTIEKINYCHNNPVKRNLAISPEDWPWSSASWYQGASNVALKMDTMDAHQSA